MDWTPSPAQWKRGSIASQVLCGTSAFPSSEWTRESNHKYRRGSHVAHRPPAGRHRDCAAPAKRPPNETAIRHHPIKRESAALNTATTNSHRRSQRPNTAFG
ncbi:hypothetical protein GCM10009807_01640 [Microbacterium lacus]|uniref:Uncharacterized protein n=1 Tax=Microbacterium lacus TaxID=415217 RepID=A0ABN2FXN1_9MICO